MRRAWRQMPWEEESFELIPAAHDEQSWSVELGDAARAISSLSRRQREALILSGIGGFSGDDVGAIVHCGRAAAKSRVCRARHALMSMLDGTMPLKAGRSRASRDSINDLLRELQQLTASAAALSEAGAACHG
jgi:DNA-directed RNA polymerase specialized sigma24 family protein